MDFGWVNSNRISASAMTRFDIIKVGPKLWNRNKRERETLVHFRNFDKRSKLKATSRDKDLKQDEGKVRRDN